MCVERHLIDAIYLRHASNQHDHAHIYKKVNWTNWSTICALYAYMDDVTTAIILSEAEPENYVQLSVNWQWDLRYIFPYKCSKRFIVRLCCIWYTTRHSYLTYNINCAHNGHLRIVYSKYGHSIFCWMGMTVMLCDIFVSRKFSCCEPATTVIGCTFIFYILYNNAIIVFL